MTLKGLLLKESLADLGVLDLIHVTKTEAWQVDNAAAYQPAVWTELSFEVPGRRADAVAGKLSRALKPRGWYINASTGTHVYVLFPGRVFKYPRGDSRQREEAKRYGRSLGIPESQLDWAE